MGCDSSNMGRIRGAQGPRWQVSGYRKRKLSGCFGHKCWRVGGSSSLAIDWLKAHLLIQLLLSWCKRDQTPANFFLTSCRLADFPRIFWARGGGRIRVAREGFTLLLGGEGEDMVAAVGA